MYFFLVPFSPQSLPHEFLHFQNFLLFSVPYPTGLTEWSSSFLPFDGQANGLKIPPE